MTRWRKWMDERGVLRRRRVGSNGEGKGWRNNGGWCVGVRGWEGVGVGCKMIALEGH